MGTNLDITSLIVVIGLGAAAIMFGPQLLSSIQPAAGTAPTTAPTPVGTTVPTPDAGTTGTTPTTTNTTPAVPATTPTAPIPVPKRTAECSSRYNGSCNTECSKGNATLCAQCNAACGLSAQMAQYYSMVSNMENMSFSNSY